MVCAPVRRDNILAVLGEMSWQSSVSFCSYLKTEHLLNPGLVHSKLSWFQAITNCNKRLVAMLVSKDRSCF